MRGDRGAAVTEGKKQETPPPVISKEPAGEFERKLKRHRDEPDVKHDVGNEESMAATNPLTRRIRRRRPSRDRVTSRLRRRDFPKKIRDRYKNAAPLQ